MNKIGKVLVSVGVLFIALAIGFACHNYYEDYIAGNNSKEIVKEILDNIEKVDEKKGKVVVYQSIHGYNVSGIISIPDLNLELPILSDWDYNRLNVGPCIYFGSIETHDLVICGHSYRTHFRYLSRLDKGDYIIITDMNNHEHIYEVCDKNVVNPYDIDSVIDSEYDLTLFSCYNGGTERIAIYCNEVNSNI